jgi:hypothetical protein
MLRALGGDEVVIRCPAAPAGNAAHAELGIEGPVTEDVTVSPVVASLSAARTSDPRLRLEFLFAAATLAPYLADRGESAENFFTGALGIVHGQKLLHIEIMSVESFAGTPYLYRVIAAE